ncbi:MAG: hypothetical protein KF799_10420 [Bdellovibrionales bacterium]|nr:hypothetical protein [Bdellovibrionales bacterium]
MRTFIGSVVLLCVSVAAVAESTNYISTGGLTEECRTLPPIPGGKYSKDDIEDEQRLCRLDFYDTTAVALCAKTWSTSPATMIYDIRESGLGQREYEAQKSCGTSKESHESLAKFKTTMHQSGTSGTFSPSALLYYHFSRLLDTTVTVPVAAYRTMDKAVHFQRVTKRAHSQNLGKSAMNKAGWKWLYSAEQNPAVYKPTSDLFTSDLKQIYGTLVDGGGARYGAEINGIRSGWGDKQNIDFQNTPAFLALRSESPVTEAIQQGLSKGLKDKTIARDMGPLASHAQMAIWMKELSEITLLDYIFSQQDRVGNIDFKWYLYYVNEDGKMKSARVRTKQMRPGMKAIKVPYKGELIQRTQLVDNDAGGRPLYQNYTKRTQMLEKIRHISGETYSRLLVLNADLQNKGEIHRYLSIQFGLNAKQVEAIVRLTKEATQIYQTTCRAGKLRFDLHSPKDVLSGKTNEEPIPCD